MEDKQIIKLVLLALKELLKKDEWLLQHDLSEQSISHKLGEYLQYLFNDFNVDCEYNGNVDDPSERKKIYLVKELLEKQGLLKEKERDEVESEIIERSVFPDIIIHRRGTNEFNLCIIEAKKSTSTVPFNYDYCKLNAYTINSTGNNLNYQIGLFIKLNTRVNTPSFVIEFFKGGKKMSVKEFIKELPPQTLEHLDIIQKDFGHEVCFEIANRKKKDDPLLMALVKLNNEPTIQCDPSYDLTTTDFVHEIWHLYLKTIIQAQAFNIDGAFEKYLTKMYNGIENLETTWMKLCSAVEHYYFLPEMPTELSPYNFQLDTLRNTDPVSDWLMYVGDDEKVKINFAIEVLNVLIIKQGGYDELADEHLEIMKMANPEGYDLGTRVMEILKRIYREPIDEPSAMFEIVKVVWNYPNLEMVRKDRQIFFQ